MRSIFYVLSIFFIFSLTCCSKDADVINDSAQFELDKKKIREYLKEYNLKADSTPEGLYYLIDYTNDSLSEDSKPTANSIVMVDYKGYLLSGLVFDSNYNQPIDLTKVIDGWRIGIPKFKEGERGRLFIPSRLAYGSGSTANIPANSPLIFEVNLIRVD